MPLLLSLHAAPSDERRLTCALSGWPSAVSSTTSTFSLAATHERASSRLSPLLSVSSVVARSRSCSARHVPPARAGTARSSRPIGRGPPLPCRSSQKSLVVSSQAGRSGVPASTTNASPLPSSGPSTALLAGVWRGAPSNTVRQRPTTARASSGTPATNRGRPNRQVSGMAASRDDRGVQFARYAA